MVFYSSRSVSLSLCLLFLVPAFARHLKGSNATNHNPFQPRPQSRNMIINGEITIQDRYPYTVQLHNTRNRRNFFCGASLIAKDLILTAAHCGKKFESAFRIVVNPYFGPDVTPADGSEEFSSVETRQHELFSDKAQFDNDLMLIKLSGVSKFKPVTLNRDNAVPFSGSKLTVVGWGTQQVSVTSHPQFLMKDDVVTVTNEYCRGQYGSVPVTDDMMCVIDDASCQGDSGGPLLLQGGNDAAGDVQVAVVSWGINCRDDVYPGVYARISHNWDWISENACAMTEDNAHFDCRTREPTTSPSSVPTSNPSKEPSSIPTATPSAGPTVVPSVSLAPSKAPFLVLVRLKTDFFPLETSWKLKTGGGVTIVQRPAGFYTEANTLFDEVMVVPESSTLYLEISDTANDGLFKAGGGYVTVYLGSSANARQVFAYSDGDFTDRVVIEFSTRKGAAFESLVPTASPTASQVPTGAPTQFGACEKIPSNGCSVCGADDICITEPDVVFSFPGQPNATCGEIEKAGREGVIPLDQCQHLPQLITDLCGCRSPTQVPSVVPSISPEPTAAPTTSQPSVSPSVSIAPTETPFEDFRIVFRTDNFPKESAWAIQEDGGTVLENIKFGEYFVPNIDETAIVRLQLGVIYTLIVYDSYGDGICCKQGDGRVTVYYGPEKEVINELVFINGNFTGSAAFVSFIAQDPKIFGPGRVDQDTATAPPGVSPDDDDGFIYCFPGDATCQIEGQGEVFMKNVKLGDKILVQGGKYEPVYSFGHHNEGIEAQYLKFVTTASSLEISKDHMVFVEGGRSVPASKVKVGDKLELAEDGELATVTAIQVVWKQGAYAPFTAGGTLIVNGVKASSFVSFQDSETLQVAGIDTGLTFQFLAHTFERPHRFWCQYVSKCEEEQYSAEGISLWVDLPHRAARWFVDQNYGVVAVVAVPLLVYFAVLAHPVVCLSLLFLAIMLAKKLSFRVNVKV